jgi:prepilin signal peptidase PulO-like enzyme (type II secretory pathway)
LGVWDLIPIFSFVFLRGRCRYCKQAISWQYPVIEITTAALFIFVAWYYLIFNSQFSIINQFSIFNFLILIRGLFFVSVLLLIFVFDLKYQIIPNRISIPALFIAVIFGVFLTLSTVNSRGALIKLFLAILIGAGFFFAQYLLSKGKWIGGGDICLGALMGAMLSWPNILVALFLAYITGAIYGIVAIIFKKKTLRSAVPFGTFLTAATFITLFYGTKILDWYLNFIV